MITILITGGCGFIGTNLVEFLLEKTDWNINILDDFSTADPKNIKNLEAHSERVHIYKGNIIKSNDVSDAIKNCTYVVNLAAQTNVMNSISNPLFDEE